MQNSIAKIADIGSINNKLDKIGQATDGKDFSKVLQESLGEVNKTLINADKAMASIATGEVKNLHQAALAIGKAQTSLRVMLEIRNKALSAYREIARTQL